MTQLPWRTSYKTIAFQQRQTANPNYDPKTVPIVFFPSRIINIIASNVAPDNSMLCHGEFMRVAQHYAYIYYVCAHANFYVSLLVWRFICFSYVDAIFAFCLFGGNEFGLWDVDGLFFVRVFMAENYLRSLKKWWSYEKLYVCGVQFDCWLWNEIS